MKRVVIGVLLLVGLVFGQREDTVFARVAENLVTNPFVSQPVRNIGQSSHILEVIAADVTSGSCVSPAQVDIGLEYSYDNVTYVRASQGITRLSANEDGVITNNQYVAGAYPFVRVNVRDFPNTTCKLTLDYSGAVAAFNVNNVATNNTFLGLAAIGNLANPSNLNIQYTPSVPYIGDVTITNWVTFTQSLYDIMDASPWMTDDTQMASLTSGTDNSSNCATWQAGNYTVFGDATFNRGASGTGFTGTFPNFYVQCDYLSLPNGKQLWASFVSANNNLVDLIYDSVGDAYTVTPKAGIGYDGFRGNSLRVTGVAAFTSLRPMTLSVANYNHLINGKTVFKTQTTPQGLKGAIRLETTGDQNNVSTMVVKYLNHDYSVDLPEFMTLRVNSGNAIRIYADDYQVFSFGPNSGVGGALDFIIWGYGVPYIPAFVNGVTDYAWGFMGGMANTTGKSNWRSGMTPTNNGTAGYGAVVAFNGLTYSQDELWVFTGNPQSAVWVNSSGNVLLDAVVKFDVGGVAGSPGLIGQLWNAVYYNVNQPADTPYAFDGSNWRTFTNNSATGTLMFRYP